MHPALYRRFLFFVGSVIALGIGLSAQAGSLRCSNDLIVFTFEKNEGLECLCETATKTINFLESMGFQTTDCITIKIIEDFPSRNSHNLFGSYNPKAQEVSMLTYSKAKYLSSKQELVSGLEMTKDLWCAFAAHELAHAIVNQSQVKIDASRCAEEYIACVTQLSVLASETLENFMEAYGSVDAFTSMDEMSYTYYLLDPNRFAVKCYRHYLSLSNPAKFIDQLIKSLPDD